MSEIISVNMARKKPWPKDEFMPFRNANLSKCGNYLIVSSKTKKAICVDVKLIKWILKNQMN